MELDGFKIQQQLASQWCWAAVSSSVAAFYARGGAFPSQCQIASEQLERDCCADAGPCDRPWYIEHALAPHLARREGGAAGLERILAEVAAGRPVCAQVEVEASVYHYVVIDAVDPRGWLRIADPRSGGKATWRIEQFSKTWTDTYWTT